MNKIQKFTLTVVEVLLEIAKTSNSIEEYRKTIDESRKSREQQDLVNMIRQFDPEVFQAGRYEKFYVYQNEIEKFLKENYNDIDVGLKTLSYLSNDLA